MKASIKFKLSEKFTANESVLSKDVRIIPDFNSLRVKPEDIRTRSDFGMGARGKKWMNKMSKMLKTEVVL